MKIYLLRHADAEGMRTTDVARELTPRGVNQSTAMGRYLAAHKIKPDLILTSPYRRTVKTAELLGAGPVKTAPFLASGMQPEDAIEQLRALGDTHSALLVGHQPDLSLLAAALLNFHDADCISFGKAALMCIDAGRVAKGGGVLQFFVPCPPLER